jgi:formiminoglutamate deiminase
MGRVTASSRGPSGRYFARSALLPGGLATDVLLEVADGRFAAITPGAQPEQAVVLPGVVLPGFANAHSHAFHRALRGRAQASGTFWTWRTAMYAVAARLDPDAVHALARAVYAEMVCSGYTSVGEFHYLHHGPAGRPYDDPNVMAEALRSAAADAGIRLTVLDACYLQGDLDGAALDPVQRRFADRDAAAWADRVQRLRESPGMRVGVAAHSVRAVPLEALRVVADVAGARPVHAHLSEQPAENEACRARHGCTPTALLHEAGLLRPAFTAVHGVHLTPADTALLAGATVCVCPSTERDLGDGIAPVRGLLDAGARLAIGSDQHVLVDPFAELQALEGHARLATLRRGVLAGDELLSAGTAHAAVGWDDAGRLAAGARADLVAVRADSPRTAGCDPAQLTLVAGAADVDTVIVDGAVMVSGGQHRCGDVGQLARRAIEPLWGDR